jgi:UDP-N-acetylmuramate: L-alanyl-gamma-D-glutamyl-meso-diaminopimelate ligase
MMESMGRIHFIAIGGAAMHSLALALHQKGYQVSGSDDEINEPSRSRLAAYGLLPEHTGWFPEKINPSLHAVILGMHARTDNPELLRAHQCGVRIFSYPEFLYEQSKNKLRVVIAGSHGKTTITAMILHVLNYVRRDFDYMVGSYVPGFDNLVRLSNAPLIVLEGDEYLSSAIDRRPKFLHYRPHIAVISGIAWDHINVFPTFSNYLEQFRQFIQTIEAGGTLIYCQKDQTVSSLIKEQRLEVRKIPYGMPTHEVSGSITCLVNGGERVPLLIFGKHNLLNAEAARQVCLLLGISDEEFYHAIQTFQGAAWRLEKIFEQDNTVIFRDFAHAPSKVKATLNAVCQQYHDRKIIACLELHTFSSLNKNFLDQYAGSMQGADEAVVFFNPQTLAHKKLPPLSCLRVREAFRHENLQVINDPDILFRWLTERDYQNAVLLLMSSGTFSGLDLNKCIEQIHQSLNRLPAG